MMIAAGMLTVSCGSDYDEIVQTVESEPTEPTIHFSTELSSKGSEDNSAKAVAGDDMSTAMHRVVTDPDDGTLDAAWQNGEKIALIYNGTKVDATVTRVGTEGNAFVEAELTGSPADGTDVKLVYPADAADASQANGIKTDYLKEGQDGTIETLSAKFDVAVADAVLKVEETGATLQEKPTLTNLYAVCKLTFQDKDNSNAAITGIRFVMLTDATTNEVISYVDCPVSAAQNAVYMVFDPTNAHKKTFTVVNGSATFKGSATPKLVASKFYRNTLKLSTSLNVPAIPVDLDLPSGTRWSNMNVGATSETDYGLFFQWGDTQGYGRSYAADNKFFHWSSYKYANGNRESLIKYAPTIPESGSFTRPSTGFDGDPVVMTPSANYVVDNIFELETSDDAAYVNWSSDWRMPSNGQIDELMENTDYEWTYISGVPGIKFSKKGDSSTYIFWPASGIRDIDVESPYPDICAYWSRSLNATWPEDGLGFFAQGPGRIEMFSNDRYFGYVVRPVFNVE